MAKRVARTVPSALPGGQGRIQRHIHDRSRAVFSKHQKGIAETGPFQRLKKAGAVLPREQNSNFLAEWNGILSFPAHCACGHRTHIHHSATVAMQQPALNRGLILMRVAAAIFLTLGLAGCAADAPVQEPTMYVDMATPGARLDTVAAAAMISLYRQNNGLGAVQVDPELMKLAETQSQAMASQNKLDHDVKAPLARRLNAFGYPANLAVENVSAGYHTLAEAFSGWRDSPPHKANMLKSGVTKLGIAASYAPNTKYKVFWTLILASTDAR